MKIEIFNYEICVCALLVTNSLCVKSSAEMGNKNMNYYDFLNNVKEGVAKLADKKDSITINHIIKNNGKELDGIVIMEEGSKVAPTIYVNSYYKDYVNGCSIETICDEIYNTHVENKSTIDINTEFFEDYRNIKDKIIYKVINYEKNQKLLTDVPHRRVLDLAVVYYFIIEHWDNISASAMVHNEHLITWKITEEDLYLAAVNNTPELFDCVIKPMSSLLNEFAKQCQGDSADNYINVFNRDYEMYVMTNKTRISGASCIFYDGVLEHFADSTNSDVYILPSSVHEVILLPKTKGFDKDVLKKMVREVNIEGVSADEVLSDNIYEYVRKDGEIIMHA